MSFGSNSSSAETHPAVKAGSAALGVIVSQFPELHETFIARELTALVEAGTGLRIYSLKRCQDRIVHPEAERLRAQTVYVWWGAPGVWARALLEGAAHPLRALATLAWTLRHHPGSPLDVVKALIVWGQALALARRMRQDGVVHIHAHWATMPTTAAAVASKWLGVPFSFTAHAWDIFVPNPALKEKLHLARRVITCTEYNRRYLSHFCPRTKGKVVLNYHGVDLSQFGNAAMAPGPGDGEGGGVDGARPLFLSVGRLVDTKGYETLLDAYRLLRERGVAFRAVIVGEGPLRRRVVRRLRQAGLADIVTLRPAMTREALRTLYSQAFAFVLPCEIAKNRDRDGIPNVILEAMAMRLPIVSTPISGIPEAVQDRRTGLLAPPGDAVRLAYTLEVLLRRKNLGRVLGDHGRMWAETQFDARDHLQHLVRQMQELLEEARDGGRGARHPIAASPAPHAPLPTKVMYVIWSLEVGGAERVVVSLAGGLNRRLFSPVVVCLNQPGRLAEELRRQGIPVMALQKHPAVDLVMLLRLIRLMRRLKVEIVHTHLWTANLWGRIAAWIAGVPVVVATEHNVDVWKRPIHAICDRLLSRGTDRLICVSEGVRTFYAQRLPCANGRLQVIHNGIEEERYAAAVPRQLAPIPDGEWAGRFPVVAVIGRLVPAKGHRDCIEALKELRPRFPSLLALFIGEGPLRGELEEAITAAGLSETIRLAGLRQDIPDVLRRIHVLLMPSLREGLPMVALEAMAAGVPVVATDVGGANEAVVDGVTGVLVPPQDPRALAQAISRLLEDPLRYQAMSAGARRRIEERFTVRRMVAQTQAMYQQAAALSECRGPACAMTNRNGNQAVMRDEQ